jgi:hypothetical protein
MQLTLLRLEQQGMQLTLLRLEQQGMQLTLLRLEQQGMQLTLLRLEQQGMQLTLLQAVAEQLLALKVADHLAYMVAEAANKAATFDHTFTEVSEYPTPICCIQT